MFLQASSGIYQWGLSIIHSVQSIGNPFLTEVMKFISFFGTVPFYAVLLTVFFWCFSEKEGFRFIFLVLFSTSINTTIKNKLQILRPYRIDSSVFKVSETGFSTPSGHAQIASTFWPNAFHDINLKKNNYIKYIAAILIIFVIGFSRVYLGVHYPTDIFIGWAIGTVFSLFGIFTWKFQAKIIQKVPTSIRILLAALPSFLLLVINKDDPSITGIFFGACTGYAYLSEKNNFSACTGTPAKKIIRYILGIATTAGIYFLLSYICPKKSSSYYALFCFIRYAVLGIWITFCAPQLFVKLKLAGSNKDITSNDKTETKVSNE